MTMNDDCLSNLEKCKASCCRLLVFDVWCPKGHPKIDYYEKRGLRVIRKSRELISVYIPHRCAQLTDDCLCKLHDTKDKPKACTNFTRETAKDGLYVVTEGCIYGTEH